MLFVEPERGNEHARDCGQVEGALVAADAGPDLVGDAEAGGQHDRDRRDRQQGAHGALAFGAEEHDAVERGDRREGKREERRPVDRRHALTPARSISPRSGRSAAKS